MHGEVIGDTSPLFAALRKSDPYVPDTLAHFDRSFCASDAAPDFFEWSAHVGEAVCPHRLTYYFDTHRHGASRARVVGERFVTFARALDAPVPDALATTFRGDVPAADALLQIVVGIDERPAEARRIKYYLVFRDEPTRIVRQIFDAVGLSVPEAPLDIRRTYILGIDFVSGGVDDVKLYFRLDRQLLARVVDNVTDFDPLLLGCRDVVFQQCVRRPERRQIYLHATHDRVIAPWLVAQAPQRPALANLLERTERVRQKLEPVGIAPWILSCVYRNRRMDASTMNVYFHLSHG